MLVSWHGRACSIHILVSILCSILNIACRYHNINRENVFGLGSSSLHEILRELQYFVVLKLRKKLNTIKHVLPLLHHFDTQARKSKDAIVKCVRTLYSICIRNRLGKRGARGAGCGAGWGGGGQGGRPAVKDI